MSEDNQKSATEKKAERSNAIEEQIKRQQKKKEERAFLEELAKRISIAREGKQFSERKDYAAAISRYRRFLVITAKAQNVEISGLHPGLFEKKTQTGESLLISSILLDMIKILDKIDNESAREERMMCHKLFIKFTVGQTFQNFAAESLRKFIVYRKTVRHKQEFWNTYNSIRVKRFCAVATWAFDGEGANEVVRLRKFRDEYLLTNRMGRSFVSFYYKNGSSLALNLNRIPGAKRAVKNALQFILIE
jgi:hypothetical protein